MTRNKEPDDEYIKMYNNLPKESKELVDLYVNAMRYLIAERAGLYFRIGLVFGSLLTVLGYYIILK